ncbi:MAG: hypothetical protein WD904_14460 [Dehalococcoidia bacterium]
MTGVKVDQLEHYDPYVNQGGASTAWVMLQTSTSPIKWAQTGWVKDYYNGRRNYAQWINQNGVDETFYDPNPPKPVGQFSKYEVLYLLNSFFFNVDGVQILSPPPVATFVPTRATIAGEVTNLASQMPGGYSSIPAHEWIYTARYMGSSGTWKAFNGQRYWMPLNAVQYFEVYDWLNWFDIDIWDKACPN